MNVYKGEKVHVWSPIRGRLTNGQPDLLEDYELTVIDIDNDELFTVITVEWNGFIYHLYRHEIKKKNEPKWWIPD